MRKKTLIRPVLNELNISLTAYRALFVLGLLIEKPRSRQKIVEMLRLNELTSRYATLETVRVTINTLKAAGCLISRPTTKNGFEYSLISHPFRIEIPKIQLTCLNIVRHNILQLGDWKLILKINDLYEKIVAKTHNDEKITYIKNSEPFRDVDREVLHTLSSSCIKNKEVNIIYNSSQFGLEKLQLVTDKLVCENGRLYLWCYLYKYNSYAYLRVDRIKSISSISLHPKTIKKEVFVAKYVVKGDSITTFKPEEGEKIIERTDKYLLVEASVLNEFKFIQRLLQLGFDFQLISPEYLKEDIICKLRSVKQGYKL